MKPITTPHHSSAHLIRLLPLIAVFLLPLRTFAQSSLSTYIHEHLYDESYDNDQTVPGATSLTESHPLNGAHWSADANASTVFGAASATAVGNSSGDGYGNSQAVARWTPTITINSSGLQNSTGIAHVTMHVTGGYTANASTDGVAEGRYTVAVEDGFGGTNAEYDGGYNAVTGPFDTQIAQIETFTFDRQFTFGQPFTIVGTVGAYGSSSFSFGASGDAHGSCNANLRLGQVVVTDFNNQPVDYTLNSDIGVARGKITAAGTIYAGFSVTNNAPGRFASTFQLLDGTASANTNVIASFVAPLDIKAASDVVDLTGTDGDLQVVQMSWDPGFASNFGDLQYLTLVYLPQNAHATEWHSATFGNYQGPPPTLVGDRAYNPATDFHLGYYGVDTANHVAWAVINHNSLFAVGIPFDLVSIASRKTHGAAGTFDINMPLTGTPGVECRSGGASGNHTLVFTFKSNLASGEVSITNGAGSIVDTPTMSANTMTVNLTGVTNAQRTTLTLHNMKDVANQLLPDTSITVGFLLGDTSGNGLVTSTDITQTKSQTGHAVTSGNFREDINANGSITGTDVSTAKLNVGSGVP